MAAFFLFVFGFKLSWRLVKLLCRQIKHYAKKDTYRFVLKDSKTDVKNGAEKVSISLRTITIMSWGSLVAVLLLFSTIIFYSLSFVGSPPTTQSRISFLFLFFLPIIIAAVAIATGTAFSKKMRIKYFPGVAIRNVGALITAAIYGWIFISWLSRLM